jgi:ribonucleoside-diphosphate reductase alpha chain/ribonucleoside-triphosphate reductase
LTIKIKESELILKRDGVSVVDYDGSKIVSAITNAMGEDDKLGIDVVIAENIECDIYDEVRHSHEMLGIIMTVEVIQDLVEDGLLRYGRKKTAKDYIKRRITRDEERKHSAPNSDENVERYINLTDDIMSEYKHKPNPFPHQMSEIIYYRTYSRFLKEKMRRENWWETTRRSVEYNTTIMPTEKSEAIKLFDLIYNLKGFLSGRTTYSGNTIISRNFPMSNFNCSFQVTDKLDAFWEGFYVLLLGCGYGFRVFEEDIEKLPKFRTNIMLVNQDYKSIKKGGRKEHSELAFSSDNIAIITVGDSKLGWVKAMEFYLRLLTDPMYFSVDTIAINYDNVRPFGERLMTFGGKASGHEALLKMFNKVDMVVNRDIKEDQKNKKLNSLDCLDIHTSIAEGVVVGGTRRSAEIGLGAKDDHGFINAKKNLYTQDQFGNWILDRSISNRQMSNNTILAYERPTREEMKEYFVGIRTSGEPAIYNAEQSLKRNKYFMGTNACGEILLDSEQMCNLTTIPINQFVVDGVLDEKELFEAYWLITRANLRMSCIELELPSWNYKQQRDKLLGVSMTGWQDMVNLTGISKDIQALLLNRIRDYIKDVADEYADELGVTPSLLRTCLKPEGTLSQLPLTSSGLHFQHSEYYLRRVRMNASEPLIKVCEELGYKIYPEVGQDWETCTTKVVEFPIKSPKGRTKYDVSAIEQLEIYQMFMENYAEMNSSITVHVRPDEWHDVEQWVYDNWDSVIGISFISLDDSFYELLPYEATTKEEYERMISEMKPFKPSLIAKYETKEYEADLALNDECSGGSCPLR